MKPAEQMMLLMAQRGFRPIREDGAYLEFIKDFADEQGRIGRATVMVERPTPSEPELRLRGFHVHVQTTLSTEEIQKAPPVMREDLAEIARAFPHVVAQQSLVRVECTKCRVQTSEFYRVDGKVLCGQCRA